MKASRSLKSRLKGPRGTANERPSPTPADKAFQFDLAAMARLGVEIWRLGRRTANAENPRVADSYDRLVRAFEDAGGRIEDRSGETFFDGMRAEILDQPDGLGPDDRLVVADTVRPAVYVGGACIIEPQLILALANPDGVVE